MTRNRVLSIAVVVLVLLNIATLTIHFLHGPLHGHGGPPHGGPKHLIIERLHFDAEQVAAYEATIKKHRRKIDALDERMMELRGQLYSVTDSAASDSLIRLIGETQSAVERVHTGHFTEIRALCKPDQVPLYDAMRKDLAGYFHPGPPQPGQGR